MAALEAICGECGAVVKFGSVLVETGRNHSARNRVWRVLSVDGFQGYWDGPSVSRRRWVSGPALFSASEISLEKWNKIKAQRETEKVNLHIVRKFIRENFACNSFVDTIKRSFRNTTL